MKHIFYIVCILANIEALAKPVCAKESRNVALVIIDMQPYFVERGGQRNSLGNKSKIEQITKEQRAAIDHARQARIPIVFVEYDCSFLSIDCGETNTDLKMAVETYREVKFVKKNTDGMFDDENKYKKELMAFLTKNRVGSLIILGANGGACVHQSIVGALENNCTVIAYNKGIADFNYEDFIYPYAGFYKEIKPNCSDCTFKEVTSIDGIGAYMVNDSGQTSLKSNARIGGKVR